MGADGTAQLVSETLRAAEGVVRPELLATLRAAAAAVLPMDAVRESSAAAAPPPAVVREIMVRNPWLVTQSWPLYTISEASEFGIWGSGPRAKVITSPESQTNVCAESITCFDCCLSVSRQIPMPHFHHDASSCGGTYPPHKVNI